MRFLARYGDVVCVIASGATLAVAATYSHVYPAFWVVWAVGAVGVVAGRVAKRRWSS